MIVAGSHVTRQRGEVHLMEARLPYGGTKIVPCMVLREATIEEFHASRRAQGTDKYPPTQDVTDDCRFYVVSVD